MAEISYPFIQDKLGRKLHYVLRLANNPSQARTVFILHGQGFSSIPSSFSDPNWNVICPLDNFGFENGGTWFLGEHGDFFVKALMLKLIEEIKQITQSDRLYFWGSSMGGYSAILYGLLCGAEAVYANVPQIKLKNTEYTDHNQSMSRCLNMVLNDDFPHWVDLTSLLETTDKRKYPCFFITQTRFHPFNYLEEHIYYFINKCNQLGVNYSLEIIPKTGHIMHRNVAQSISLFDTYQQDIQEWVEKRTMMMDFKNKTIKAYKNNSKDNFIEIHIDMECDANVGDKDLLLSFNPVYFKENEPSYYDLVLSPNQEIGLFKYINTKQGKNKLSFLIPLPKQDYIEFSVKPFYPKGITRVYNVDYKTLFK